MVQQRQVFKLASDGREGGELWAYRYRTGGRDSKRLQWRLLQRGGHAGGAGAGDGEAAPRARLGRRFATLRASVSRIPSTYG
jgi:hypothetical protein